MVEGSFPGGSVVKDLPAKKGDAGSITGLGRSPGEGEATHSRMLAWEIQRQEETGRLRPRGHKRVGHDWATKQQVLQIVEGRAVLETL